MDGEKNEQQSLEGKYSRKYISRKHDLCLWMGPISLINGFCLASWSTAAPPYLLIIKACVGFITYGSFLKPLFSQQTTKQNSRTCDSREVYILLGALRLQNAAAGRGLGGWLVHCHSPHLGHSTPPLFMVTKITLRRRRPGRITQLAGGGSEFLSKRCFVGRLKT